MGAKKRQKGFIYLFFALFRVLRVFAVAFGRYL